MKTYYYDLDQIQANFIKDHDKMVIVVPLKKQPPEGYVLNCPVPYGNKWWIFCEEQYQYSEDKKLIKIACQYLLGVRVGLRETCFIRDILVLGNNEIPLKIKKHSAIQYWGIVEDVRGDRVQNVMPNEICTMGIMNLQAGFIEKDLYNELSFWFNNRYKGVWKFDYVLDKIVTMWEQNLYCEIMRVRKE